MGGGWTPSCGACLQYDVFFYREWVQHFHPRVNREVNVHSGTTSQSVPKGQRSFVGELRKCNPVLSAVSPRCRRCPGVGLFHGCEGMYVFFGLPTVNAAAGK